jgi:hypothetical protein
MPDNKKPRVRTFRCDEIIYSYEPTFYYEKGIVTKTEYKRCPDKFNAHWCIFVEVKIGSGEEVLKCSGVFDRDKAVPILNDLHGTNFSQHRLSKLVNLTKGCTVVVRVDQYLRVDRLYREDQFADE